MSQRNCLRIVIILGIFATACGVSAGGGGGGVHPLDASGKDLGISSDSTATVSDGSGSDSKLNDGQISDGNLSDGEIGEDVEIDLGPIDAGCGANPCCSSATAAVQCDDKDPCTNDSCSEGLCIHAPISGCGNANPPCGPGSPCPLGVCDLTSNACVSCLVASDCLGGGSLCIEQKCVVATACKSDVTCKPLSKVCDKVAGACVECNLSADCGADAVCSDHVCKPSKSCSSSKDCPSVCDLASGQCVDCLSPDDCSADKFCNSKHQCQVDVCTGGGCQPGKFFACKPDGSGYSAAVLCEDGNACTDNICDAQKGCQVVNNSATCDDKSACTDKDVCSGGKCKGTTLNCDDGNPCTSDACSTVSGCTHTNSSASCDDGNACTTGDFCSGGSCKGSTLTCNDGNACTDDSCNPKSGCAHSNNTAACTDNSACTSGDTCSGGICKGTTVVCNDNNPCTANQCIASSGCSYPATSGSCDDGDACTIGDACSFGSCASGSAKDCSDGNPCTDDSCFGGTCTNVNNAAACDDGNYCTLYDACGGGKCLAGSTPQDCNDGNVCTDDSCVPAFGCSYKNNTASCDDGDACTVSDICGSGYCNGGGAKDCDDKNGCTIDSCDASTGCLHAADAVKCDDNDVCTLDKCVAPGGTCTHDAIAGCCKLQATCDDGNTCTTDTCAGNVCVHQTTANCCKLDGDCTDGNQCTADACSSGKCGHVSLSGALTPTWSVDWEKDAAGFVGGSVPGGWLWTQATLVAHDGIGSYGLTGTTGSFSGLKTSVSSTATSAALSVPAGGTYALKIWYRIDLTAGSGVVTVNALVGNNVIQLGTSNTLNSWGQFIIEASALGGQKFQLQLKAQVTGTSTTPASGKGIFFDSISLTGTCGPSTCVTASDCPTSLGDCFVHTCTSGTCGFERTCCSNDAECSDGNACTLDACSSGSCAHTSSSTCCASSSACDDKNACTLDLCTGGNCENLAIAECCLGKSDCADSNPCTIDVCGAENKCVYLPACCTQDADCNDGDATCTTDSCVNKACVYAPTNAPGCCTPGIYSESFDSAISGWTFTNSAGVSKGWQQWLSATLSQSAPGVLYYGDPSVKNFNFSTNSGTATSPSIQLPSTTNKLTLTMKVYFDSESGDSFDKLTVSIGGTPVWHNSQGTAKTWNTVSYDVSSFNGQSVALGFSFSTGDGVANSGLGILVDDIAITQSCN